jgi:parallel beta-helix repeat protein
VTSQRGIAKFLALTISKRNHRWCKCFLHLNKSKGIYLENEEDIEMKEAKVAIRDNDAPTVGLHQIEKRNQRTHMKRRKFTISSSLGLLLLMTCLGSGAEAQCTASIGATNFATIQSAVNAALVGQTILVSGTCNENVVVFEGKDRITLDGQAVTTSTINGPDATSASVLVNARRVTIRRFTITGGRQGLLVNLGGEATIDGNRIQFVGQRGIQANQNGDVTIINNTIQNNPEDGVRISENSVGRIGLTSGDAAAASPNTIQNNGGRGITVNGSSNARIAGNTISGNADDGVGVNGVSQVDAASNVISGNGGDGIFVSENSGVNLGNDTGSTFLDLPNSTVTNNTGFGLRCAINSYAQGRLGTLNGLSGPGVIFSPPSTPGFSGACINSLIR